MDRSLISRMELGRGGGIPLDKWVAVSDAVGLRFDLTTATHADVTDRDHDCRDLVTDVAAKGGWTAVKMPYESIISRGSDRVVIHVWDPVTVVAPEISRLEEAMAREDANGLVVVPATGANRRRMSESRDELRERFPVAGNRWFVALISGRPVPRDPGILWAWPDCQRLRVAGNPAGWIWTKVGDGPRFATGRRHDARGPRGRSGRRG